ncbi:hypothetical protein [Marinobacterium rhizophilum]|nr:hypothetical protein [Marinobacterium rhizophilum]
MRLQNTLINPGTHRSRLALLAGAVSLALSGAGRLRLDAVLARRF